ncbi:MAG: hypothetical protein ABIR47_08025, partial [Candidatus Kapaibacterium sp.]
LGGISVRMGGGRDDLLKQGGSPLFGYRFPRLRAGCHLHTFSAVAGVGLDRGSLGIWLAYVVIHFTYINPSLWN